MLLSSSECYWVLLSVTECSWVLVSDAECYWVVGSVSVVYWVLVYMSLAVTGVKCRKHNPLDISPKSHPPSAHLRYGKEDSIGHTTIIFAVIESKLRI